MNIRKAWCDIYSQRVDGKDGDQWLVSDLITRAEKLQVNDMPLEHLCLDFSINGMNVKEFVSHMKIVLDADLEYPIILDENACVFDGRHRVARALLEDIESIKYKRFEEDPQSTIRGEKNK